MSAFVSVLALLLIAVSPFSIGAAAFLWKIHADDRAADDNRPRIRLSFVMALTGSIAAVCAFYLALAAFAMLAGRIDIARALTPITLAIFVLLDVIPLLNAAYLQWLRRTGGSR